MKTFASYRKAGMRYVVLMVLGMALLIVAKPQRAQAVTPCVQNCLFQLQFCGSLCHNNSACSQECVNEWNTCRFEC
jgi:hypothetical protein